MTVVVIFKSNFKMSAARKFTCSHYIDIDFQWYLKSHSFWGGGGKKENEDEVEIVQCPFKIYAHASSIETSGRPLFASVCEYAVPASCRVYINI